MAIFHDIEQGTGPWWDVRLGLPTASSFDKILTPTGKPSAQAKDYMCLLLAERLTGQPQTFCVPTDAMARGTELEPQAASAYALMRDATLKAGGFFTDDARRYGASPDRLVGEDGLLEIKCPMAKQHVANLLSGELDSKYTCQVQGQLLASERQWVDWVSYCPGLPIACVRVYRDEKIIGLLKECLNDFCEALEENFLQLKSL